MEDGSNNSVNISNTCNGYQNLMPNFITITSGTCDSNGYKFLISEHECALAAGKAVDIIMTNVNKPKGCHIDEDGFYNWNTENNASEDSGENRGICKQ